MGANDLPANGIFSIVQPPSQNRWPIDISSSNAQTGIIVLLTMATIGVVWGLLALSIYILKGRHAKDNWKQTLDVDDVESHKVENEVRVKSLKRKPELAPSGRCPRNAAVRSK